MFSRCRRCAFRYQGSRKSAATRRRQNESAPGDSLLSRSIKMELAKANTAIARAMVARRWDGCAFKRLVDR